MSSAGGDGHPDAIDPDPVHPGPGGGPADDRGQLPIVEQHDQDGGRNRWVTQVLYFEDVAEGDEAPRAVPGPQPGPTW